MKVAILGVESFIGCNISNYLMQHSKFDVFGVVGTDTMKNPHLLPHLEPSLKSRTRFSMQFSAMLSFEDPYTNCVDRFKYEAPDVTIVVNGGFGLTQALISAGIAGRLLGVTEPGHFCSFKNGGDIRTPRVYGPREWGNRWFAKTCDAIVDGTKIPPALDGGWHSSSEWIYIKDLFDVVASHIENPEPKVETIVGYKASESQIRDELVAIATGCDISERNNARLPHLKFGLSESIEHTLAWRGVNKWIRAVQ